jgi:hypothetical protein
MIMNAMPAAQLGDVAWRKSGRSNSPGNCEGLARLDGRAGGAGLTGMRDSKQPDGPALIFPAGQISAWVAEERKKSGPVRRPDLRLTRPA